MSSKLDDHTQFILAEAAQGLAWTEIARRLSSKGVVTSGRLISQWAARRAKRIAGRAALLDPLASAAATRAASSGAADGASGVQSVTGRRPAWTEQAAKAESGRGSPAVAMTPVPTPFQGQPGVHPMTAKKPVAVDLTDLVGQPEEPPLLRKPRGGSQ
jgi:hypothetical protein